MAYTPVQNRLGIQPINLSNTANTALQSGQSPFFNAEHPLGTIVNGYDPSFGEGEFIYLVGVAGTAIGSLVTWDAVTYQTTLLPVLATSKNTSAPVAVAMSANLAGQWGWYQISGMAVVLKTAVQVTPTPVAVFASGTAGRLKLVASAGGQILGARTANAATVTSTTSTIVVHISRPVMQGQIT